MSTGQSALRLGNKGSMAHSVCVWVARKAVNTLQTERLEMSIAYIIKRYTNILFTVKFQMLTSFRLTHRQRRTIPVQ